MHSLLLVLFFAHIDPIYTAPWAENLFSPGFSEPGSDYDLFSSEGLSPLDANSNDLAGNLNEPIFGSADAPINLDTLTGDPDMYIPLDMLAAADGSVDSNALQSSCATEGSVPNDVLRTRDSLSCPSIEGQDKIQLPDLFQDPESVWPRLLPKLSSPSDKKGVRPFNSIFQFFDELTGGGGGECPPDYPIRCCTDQISGYAYFVATPSIYYIRPADCLFSMFLVLLSFARGKNCADERLLLKL